MKNNSTRLLTQQTPHHHRTQYRLHWTQFHDAGMEASRKVREKLNSFLLPDSCIHVAFPKVTDLGIS